MSNDGKGNLGWALLLLVAAALACNLPIPSTGTGNGNRSGGDTGTAVPGSTSPDVGQAEAVATGTMEPLFDYQTTSSQVPVYRLVARLTSTSDWTRVAVEGADAAGTDHRVLQGEDAPGLNIRRVPELWITREGSSAEAVTVEYDYALRNIAEDGIRVRIGKGHSGRTELELFRLEEGERVSIKSMVFNGVGDTSGPFNRKYFTISSEPLTTSGPSQVNDRMFRKKLFAFYYPWYGSPQGPTGEWRAWRTKELPHTPVLGLYDSMDPDVFREHVREARRAGVDGFIVSWWGVGEFTDRVVQDVILPVAEEEEFPVALYYEAADSRGQILRDFRRILTTYGKSPAYMRVDGDPVIFVYGRVATGFTRQDWEFIFDSLAEENLGCFCQGEGLAAAYHEGDPRYDYLFDLFDGVHMYFQGELPIDLVTDLNADNALKADVFGTSFAATVNPGFDNSPWFAEQGADRLKIDRADGDFYRSTWQAAVSSDPDWILLTSFNEWFEGTEVEPSEELGDRYLDLTAELAADWKQGG